IYPDSGSQVKALLNDEVDIIVSNAPSLIKETERYPMEVIKVYPTDELYGAAIQNGDVILTEIINKGLADFELSGKRAELLKKYGLN
ncbi:MAG: transporter substrate-binding domain-containing protein, partial [Methanocorpusculum sp.]|nr:transporter substrate-binding domain-containing protein [Methanocorpusculum sp.]